jgi:proteasome accessory factor C
MRTFRTDRIVSHTRTGEFVDPPDDDLPTPGQWFSGADLQRATIRVPEQLMWLIERYPVDEVTTLAEPGWVEVVLPVTSEHWLARLMVRLGPSAQVVAPESWRDVGRAAAAAILARYQTT